MKKNRIIFWIATIIIVLWEGVMPLGSLLFAPDQATVGTQPLGYPDYFAYALVICKVLGALAISIPGVPAKLREWAYAGLTFNLIFAFISHAAVDQIIGFMLLPLVILGILVVSYVYSQKLVPSGNTDYQTTDSYQLAVSGNR
ncbi:DoxX family protein [Parapedobacter indicus]|uniref:DoxX-like family protein n=1 Tax=Parapedobacter indicus TaxID=1477437 RepID=A0A1I3GLA7_9SPHI|nr:DoxX family protein [Parapedobacter indicus]PPL02697.1 DoxX-like protein [Parapedobacter indicus]SFI24238.1 DoxX-like family protein [Parapedobacter indicus]